MLQTLSDAFLAQFQNDEGQALTIMSETISSATEIIIPFVLDNSLGRDTNIFISWPEEFPSPAISLILPSKEVVTDEWVSMDFQVQITFSPQKFGGVTVKIKGLGDVGHYDLVIRNEAGDEFPISCSINSFPRDESYPVKMTTHAIQRDSGKIK